VENARTAFEVVRPLTSNIRGTSTPLYLLGSQVTELFAVGALNALELVISSYCGQLRCVFMYEQKAAGAFADELALGISKRFQEYIDVLGRSS
jgi:hypothetical protein